MASFFSSMFFLGLAIGLVFGAGGVIVLALAMAAGRADRCEIVYPESEDE